MNKDPNYVTLVATETLTPYRAGEIFTLPKDQAEMVLHKNTGSNDFHEQIYPKVKARLLDPDSVDDQKLILKNKVLNQKDHEKLVKELLAKGVNLPEEQPVPTAAEQANKPSESGS